MSWGAGAAPASLESACLDEGVSFRDRPTPRRRTWPGVREDLETLPKGLGLNASSVWFLIFHPKFWEHSTCHEMVVVAEPVTPLRAGHGIKEWRAVLGPPPMPAPIVLLTHSCLRLVFCLFTLFFRRVSPAGSRLVCSSKRSTAFQQDTVLGTASAAAAPEAASPGPPAPDADRHPPQRRGGGCCFIPCRAVSHRNSLCCFVGSFFYHGFSQKCFL